MYVFACILHRTLLRGAAANDITKPRIVAIKIVTHSKQQTPSIQTYTFEHILVVDPHTQPHSGSQTTHSNTPTPNIRIIIGRPEKQTFYILMVREWPHYRSGNIPIEHTHTHTRGKELGSSCVYVCASMLASVVLCVVAVVVPSPLDVRHHIVPKRHPHTYAMLMMVR